MTEASSANSSRGQAQATGRHRAGRPAHRRGGRGHPGPHPRLLGPGAAVRRGRRPAGHLGAIWWSRRHETPRRRPIPAPRRRPPPPGPRPAVRRRRCGGCGRRSGTSRAAWPPCARHWPRSGWTSSACRPIRWPDGTVDEFLLRAPTTVQPAELTGAVSGAGGADLAGAGRRPRSRRRDRPGCWDWPHAPRWTPPNSRSPSGSCWAAAPSTRCPPGRWRPAARRAGAGRGRAGGAPHEVPRPLGGVSPSKGRSCRSRPPSSPGCAR